ncbi:MAG: hypothetical protein ACTSUO_09665 [Candidatus Thorarchaeota archaeon]
MTQILFVPPTAITVFNDQTDDEISNHLIQLLDGSLAGNIKSLVLDELSQSIAFLLDDPQAGLEKTQKSFPILLKLVKKYATKKFISNVEKHISQVASANYRYSYRILISLVGLLGMSIKNMESVDFEMPSWISQEITETLSEIALFDSDMMPDATSFYAQDNESNLPMLILSFNITLFMTLVIIVANMAEYKTALTESHIDQIESLLRDWSQEIITQLNILSKSNQTGTPSVNLEGINSDPEDQSILEEGLLESVNDSE